MGKDTGGWYVQIGIALLSGGLIQIVGTIASGARSLTFFMILGVILIGLSVPMIVHGTMVQKQRYDAGSTIASPGVR